jgi:hypothetical protein
MTSGFHLPSVKLHYGVFLLYLAVYGKYFVKFELTPNVDSSLDFV